MPPRRMHGCNDVSRSQNQTLEAACRGGQGGASADHAQSGIKLRAKRKGNMMRNDAKASKGCVAEKILTRARKED